MKKKFYLINDEELFRLIQEKDKSAFSLVYDKYHRLIYATALDFLKDTTLAEEVVQQIFIDLWERASHLTIHESLRNYLYTMARNHILKIIRQKNKEVEVAYELQIIQRSTTVDSSEKIEKERMYKELYKAIDKLPGKIRKVCLLKLKRNMDNDAISRELGVSTKTVNNDYNNAILFLRRILKGRIIYGIIYLLITGGFRG